MPITVKHILEIHHRVLFFVNPIETGQLRQEQVYLDLIELPGADKVPALLEEFLKWLNSYENATDSDAITLATEAHYKFEIIHPFMNGNGRTGRLLMNFILMRSGFPPIVIDNANRGIYLKNMHCTKNGDIKPLVRFFAKCVEQTLIEFLQYL